MQTERDRHSREAAVLEGRCEALELAKASETVAELLQALAAPEIELAHERHAQESPKPPCRRRATSSTSGRPVTTRSDTRRSLGNATRNTPGPPNLKRRSSRSRRPGPRCTTAAQHWRKS